MPANLNALIRYKTIDRCLSTGRKYTTDELIKACSEALGEYRGVYKTISKRTFHEDLHIMRSDILGFNAPIKNSDGLYFYETPNYSVFDKHISKIDTLKRVVNVLFDIYQETEEENIGELLNELTRIPELRSAIDIKFRRGTDKKEEAPSAVSDELDSYNLQPPILEEKSMQYRGEVVFYWDLLMEKALNY